MKYGSFFSGISADSVAAQDLPMEATFFSENSRFPSAVLNHHYPDTPNLGDIRGFDPAPWRGKLDGVIGSPPCQSFSLAGAQGGLDDDRGGLTLEYARAVTAISPRWCLTENVGPMLGNRTNPFGHFLGIMVGSDAPLYSPHKHGRWPSAGLVAGPRGKTAWRVLDAQYFGLAQRRKRLFALSSFGAGPDPAQVLFEPQSMCGGPPSRPEKIAPIAGTITRRFGGGGGTDHETGNGLIVGTLPARSCHGGGFASEIDFDGGLQIARCITTREGRSHSMTLVASTLTASWHRSKGAGAGNNPGLTNPVIEPEGVRRLTVRECERLQGFPDDYTLIPCQASTRWVGPDEAEEMAAYLGWPLEMVLRKGVPPDGPRYKAIGNSIATNVLEWIFKRILEVSQ